mgnify:FL=1
MKEMHEEMQGHREFIGKLLLNKKSNIIIITAQQTHLINELRQKRIEYENKIKQLKVISLHKIDHSLF